MTTDVTLDISGMTCASCATRIERKLNKLDGVTASVSYATEKARAVPDTVTTDDLLHRRGRGVRRDAVPVREPGGSGPSRRAAGQCVAHRRRVAMVPACRSSTGSGPRCLAAPVAVWGAWPFHRAAWANLRPGATRTRSLARCPAASAGQLAPAHGAHRLETVYLEVAAGVTTFLLAGRYLEKRAKRRAGEALRALLGLGARESACCAMVPVRCRSSPSAGVRGAAWRAPPTASSSAVPRRSTPRCSPARPSRSRSGRATRSPGPVNAGGRLVVRATRVGADTRLAQMARLVDAAQNGKADVQRLADRVSGVFVPAVIALAAGALGFWLGTGAGPELAFTSAVAVLIVACPCALGLATPTALMVGTGRGAQLGILIRGPEVLEDTRRVDTVVLDKTGTVTTGRMTLVEVVAAPGWTSADVSRLAASVESASEHPVGRAVAAAYAGDVPRSPGSRRWPGPASAAASKAASSRSGDPARAWPRPWPLP